MSANREQQLAVLIVGLMIWALPLTWDGMPARATHKFIVLYVLSVTPIGLYVLYLLVMVALGVKMGLTQSEASQRGLVIFASPLSIFKIWTNLRECD